MVGVVTDLVGVDPVAALFVTHLDQLVERTLGGLHRVGMKVLGLLDEHVELSLVEGHA